VFKKKYISANVVDKPCPTMTLEQLLEEESKRDHREKKSWSIYHMARLSDSNAPVSPLKVARKYIWGASKKEVLSKVLANFYADSN